MALGRSGKGMRGRRVVPGRYWWATGLATSLLVFGLSFTLVFAVQPGPGFHPIWLFPMAMAAVVAFYVYALIRRPRWPLMVVESDREGKE